MYIGCAKTGPILAQPGEIKMVVLDCPGLGQVVPKRDHILAQPMMVVVLECANGSRFSTTFVGCARF